MNRSFAFASRCFRELMRDPLGYIFVIGFPIMMLLIMTAVDRSVPADKGPTLFRIESLTPATVVFGQGFLMLFTALSIATDRKESFLTRLYATPMTAFELSAGYILPMLFAALIQAALTLVTGFIISVIEGCAMNAGGLLFCLIMLMPSALMYIGFGVVFGVLFSDKAAPGVSSMLISLGSFLGGVWFDPDATGGIMLTICKCLPFYYCTHLARASAALEFTAEGFFIPLIVVVISAAALIALGCFCFTKKMRADLG